MLTRYTYSCTLGKAYSCIRIHRIRITGSARTLHVKNGATSGNLHRSKVPTVRPLLYSVNSRMRNPNKCSFKWLSWQEHEIDDSGQKPRRDTQKIYQILLFTIPRWNWYSQKVPNYHDREPRTWESARTYSPIVRRSGNTAPLTRIPVCDSVHPKRYFKRHTFHLFWHKTQLLESQVAPRGYLSYTSTVHTNNPTCRGTLNDIFDNCYIIDGQEWSTSRHFIPVSLMFISILTFWYLIVRTA